MYYSIFNIKYYCINLYINIPMIKLKKYRQIMLTNKIYQENNIYLQNSKLYCHQSIVKEPYANS